MGSSDEHADEVRRVAKAPGLADADVEPAGASGPDPSDRLGPVLLNRLREADASEEEQRQFALLLDLDSNWRRPAAPLASRHYPQWPGRVTERASDAYNHLPGSARKADGPAERHRRYCYDVISLMLRCNVTAADLADRPGFEFDTRSMIRSLRGKSWGRAAHRQRYLQSLLCEALDHGDPPAQLAVWLSGWGAPVTGRDPVLYLDARGVARGYLRRLGP